MNLIEFRVGIGIFLYTKLSLLNLHLTFAQLQEITNYNTRVNLA